MSTTRAWLSFLGRRPNDCRSVWHVPRRRGQLITEPAVARHRQSSGSSPSIAAAAMVRRSRGDSAARWDTHRTARRLRWPGERWLHRRLGLTPPWDADPSVRRAIPGTLRGQSRFTGVAFTRGLLCGLVILVGIDACGAQVGIKTDPSGSSAPCFRYRAFSLSLVKDTGGEKSPIAAARWFAAHGGVWSDLPANGWTVIGSSGSSTSVRAGSFTLEVWRGRDGTWQVANGSDATC